MDDRFHIILKSKIKEYVHLVYSISKDFPTDERFGLTSQARRAAMSVLLNYVEGFARVKLKVNINHLETAYASLKESDVALEFANEEGYVKKISEYNKAVVLADEIAAMLWSTITKKRNS